MSTATPVESARQGDAGRLIGARPCPMIVPPQEGPTMALAVIGRSPSLLMTAAGIATGVHYPSHSAAAIHGAAPERLTGTRVVRAPPV